MRLLAWPFVFLIYLAEAVEEFRWRLWLAMWVTANWALGQENYHRLAIIVIKKRHDDRVKSLRKL